MYRIATREALRNSKRERFWSDAGRDEELSAVPGEDSEQIFDRELFEKLSDALPDLSPASQLVLRMHYMDEMSYVEISEALEISVGTVKSRVAYGLGTLRRRLTNQGET